MFVFQAPTPASHTRSADPSLLRGLHHLLADTAPAAADAARVPAMDVRETDTHYSLTLDMPGLSKEQIQVSVHGRRISVESHPTDAAAAPGDKLLYRERQAARYARTISLPAEVDEGQSSATYEQGVLNLTLAKRVPTGATQLAVR
jgi:HSP20 family protein